MYALEGVGRSFRDGSRMVEAVAGVDLEVGDGEHVSIVGPSGSGKTTLLQLLGALDTPTAGSVRLAGRDLAGLGERERTRVRAERVGFVFQQFNLIPTLTARANVEAALVPLGVRGADRRDRALARLDDVGLAGRSDHLPGELSGGEQQRVAIARALVKDPAVILADEPTGSLDATASAGIAELLGSLAGEGGRTVVVVTHDPDVAARAPRVVRLHDGRVAADGPPGRISGLASVELGVEDLDRAVAWYAEVLGVSVARTDGRAVARLGREAGELVLVTGHGRARVALRSGDPHGIAGRATAAGAGAEDGDQAIAIIDPWGNRIELRPEDASDARSGPSPE